MHRSALVSLCSLLLFSSAANCKEDKAFVIIIPSYNNINYYQDNLNSLFEQEKSYQNWRAIYIDDHSPDGTEDAVKKYLAQHGFEHKVTVKSNDINVGALANIYNAVHTCDDHEIVLLLDGDDMLNPQVPVLKILNDAYQHDTVWMTYGQYVEYPSRALGLCRQLPWDVIEWNAHRKYTWVTSHLRTFYAGLFKKIKKEDLMHDGAFYPMTWDLAIMFPMLEMAGHHVRFIPETLYLYNLENPISDWRKDIDLVIQLHNIIRKKTPYDRLVTLDEKNV